MSIVFMSDYVKYMPIYNTDYVKFIIFAAEIMHFSYE